MKYIGFEPEELASRYDVDNMDEDLFHQLSTFKTYDLVHNWVSDKSQHHGTVLNAGSGVYRLNWPHWTEVRLDLFQSPLNGDPLSVCGDLQHMEFDDASFDAVVCVGEVLSYCSPSTAISEIRRVLKPNGFFVLDYGNTKGFKQWLKPNFGCAANLVTVKYNGAPEKVWIFHPQFIEGLLLDNGFKINSVCGIHTWSSLLIKFGIPIKYALKAENHFPNIFPYSVAETIIVLADVY